MLRQSKRRLNVTAEPGPPFIRGRITTRNYAWTGPICCVISLIFLQQGITLLDRVSVVGGLLLTIGAAFFVIGVLNIRNDLGDRRSRDGRGPVEP